ncbi:hypothetical protein [Nitrososphaera sp.]|uniref:hypothetical protein n=1 Tax=Nitrososphaera sp. TaxID=1971748 RepID=UPI00307E54B7
MCAHHDSKAEGGYHMTGVAWTILVMGVSLAIIFLMWAFFGYIGPKFSEEVMLEQQAQLREQYGFPPAEKITAQQAQTPPSLRHLNGSAGQATAATNASSSGAAATAAEAG